jgi:OOP family OmpA-OmpF porin
MDAQPRWVVASTALMTMLLATAAFAADAPGSINVTPMVHGQWQDDARRASDDFTWSLAIGRTFGENWTLELSGQRGEFDGVGGDNLVLTSVGLNALRVFYRDSRIAPYLLLGAGWQEENTRFESTEHDPYADTGVGLLVRLGDVQTSPLSLRGEIKARHTFIGDDDRLVDYLMGVGLHFAFGGQPAEAESMPIPADSGPFDSDGDGIRDNADRCPNTPPGARIDDTGCERDSDGDGILDSRDKCPGSRQGLVIDAAGCEADTDRDGVLDSKDRCANTPRGDRIDAQGCSLTVRLEVLFLTNSAEIRPESAAELDRVAALLRSLPSFAGVIEGHTDDVGSARSNQALSQRRAEAVLNYLIERGVDASRLRAEGFGESRPEASNSTPEGRAQNRRVLLKRTDPP